LLLGIIFGPVITMLKGVFGKLSKSKNDDKKKKKSDIEEEFDEVSEEIEGEAFEGFDEGFGEGLEDESDLEKTGKFTELESRIKDLENEVGLISSKLNTIKAENEEIGRRLEEIEENIRKLLGIYEMVTEGINPFATEVGGLSEDGFGIFSSLNKDKEKEDLPEDIISKEPESFFEDLDEDFEEVPTSEDFSTEGLSGESPGESPEEKFQKLKKELEMESKSASEQPEEFKEEFAEEIPEAFGEEEKLESAEATQEFVEPVVEPQKTEEVYSETQPVTHEASAPRLRSGPYLRSIRRDYISDILVLKWLDYLVSTFGLKRMAELLDFYVDIGWISKDVKEFLINCSRGCTLRDMQFVEDSISNMPTLKDHIKSLIFISKLSGEELNVEEIEKVIKEIEELEKEVSDIVPLDHGTFNISC